MSCKDDTLIYQSSTHGDIPLSFTGKRLLANEREAATVAIEKGDYSANDQALSKARGDIAKYMSTLEQRSAPPTLLGVDWGAAEARTLAAAMTATPAWRSPEQIAADDFLDAAAEFNEARANLRAAAQRATDAGLKPTWKNPQPRPDFSKLRPPQLNGFRRFDEHTFVELEFEVSCKVKTERVVVEEKTVVMGREP